MVEEKTDTPREDLHSSARPGLPCCPPHPLSFCSTSTSQWIYCHRHPVGRECPNAIITPTPTALCMLPSAPSRGEKEEGRGTRVSMLPAEGRKHPTSHILGQRVNPQRCLWLTESSQTVFSLLESSAHTQITAQIYLILTWVPSRGISICQGQTWVRLGFTSISFFSSVPPGESPKASRIEAF